MRESGEERERLGGVGVGKVRKEKLSVREVCVRLRVTATLSLPNTSSV